MEKNAGSSFLLSIRNSQHSWIKITTGEMEWIQTEYKHDKTSIFKNYPHKHIISRDVFIHLNTEIDLKCYNSYSRSVCGAVTFPQQFVKNRKRGVEHEHKANTMDDANTKPKVFSSFPL